ncbi:MAG: hypothetical protein JWO72_2820 [Caulobacteraceae bacterium]|nr:hypothetical protein [Caulobacteraceae bacterium]
MFKKLIAAAAALALGGAIVAGPASAHHSYAMFDSATTMTLAGTVVSWDWTNPHSFLQFMADGQHWDLEAASPSMLSRAGMTRNSLKPGDKVTVKLHPRRDKALGGSLQSVVLADGKTLVFEAGRQPQPQPQPQ